MQTAIVESLPTLPFLASDAECEFLERKRLVLSPIEVCMLNPDDFFDDED